jgi:hypothetical protein
MAATRELTLLLRVRDEATKALGSLGVNVKKADVVMTAAGAAAATLGGALSDAARAGMEDAAAMEAVRVAVENTGGSWETAGGQINDYINKMRDSAAIADDDMKPALANLISMTGDYEKSMSLAGLAADIAKGKNIDLSTAATLVGKVAQGNTSALTRYGIVLRDGATTEEALAELQKRFAGQAEAYGATQQGQLEATKLKLEDFREEIGQTLGGMAPFIGALPGLSTGFSAAGGAVSLLLPLLKDTTLAHQAGKLAMEAAAIAQQALTGAQWLLNAAMTANPIGIIVLALVALAGALIWAYQNVEPFRLAVDTAFAFIRDFVGNALVVASAAIDGFVGGVQGAGLLIIGIWDGIAAGIKGSINNIIGAINGFIGFINALQWTVGPWSTPFGEIGGFTIGMPQVPLIPYLAKGGIVTGPTLAMIGERGPEAVVPLSGGGMIDYDRLADAIATKLGGQQIVLQLDGRAMARALRPYTDNMTRIMA